MKVERKDNLKHNLFRFATSELSHSAFWAWVLQATSSESDGLEAEAEVGRAFLSKLDLKAPAFGLDVKTEVRLGSKRDRVDILVEIPTDRDLIIETKTAAIPDPEQLNRYQAQAEKLGMSVRLLLLSTSFDEDFRLLEDKLPLWTRFGPEELLDFVVARTKSSVILDQYDEWLRDLIAKRLYLREAACGSDAHERKEAMDQAEGQWYLMEKLTTSMVGSQYRGTNIGGKPWTQFRFCKNDGVRDALFYRIDVSKDGPYFSFRQYQRAPTPSLEAKMSRLEDLRRTWGKCMRASGVNLPIRSPSNRGKKESEVMRLDLNEVTATDLAAALVLVHKCLVGELLTLGWSVSETMQSTAV